MSLAETTARPPITLCASGLGLGTTCQVLPSQCSMSVEKGPFVVLLANPAAQTSSAPTTATASRALLTDPGLGMGITCHPMPSQCSMSVCPVIKPRAPGVPPEKPTAQTSFASTAATLKRALSPPG